MARGRGLIAGNWKMHGRAGDVAQVRALREALGGEGPEAALCPPSPYLEAFVREAGDRLLIGAQDVSAEGGDGAFTGEVSAAMLADLGARIVIVGHSERRARFGEAGALIAAKAAQAQAQGLRAIVCVGETRAERDAGRAMDIVRAQVLDSTPSAPQGLIIAYEPVWAIGAGVTPEPSEIEAIHAVVRGALNAKFAGAGEGVAILYGGSVKPANAAEILATPGVDGALVGGASLKAADFLAIIAAFPK